MKAGWYLRQLFLHRGAAGADYKVHTVYYIYIYICALYILCKLCIHTLCTIFTVHKAQCTLHRTLHLAEVKAVNVAQQWRRRRRSRQRGNPRIVKVTTYRDSTMQQAMYIVQCKGDYRSDSTLLQTLLAL